MILTVIIIFISIVILGYILNFTEEYDRQKKRVEMSFKEAMNLVDLPIVTFVNNNRKFNFLLDTGSNGCVINSRELEFLNYEKVGNTGTIHGMEGKSVEVTYVNIEFSYNEKFYSSTFQVVDMQEAFDKVKKESGVTIHGILGSKFFEEYKYVLDFDELIAYSK